MPSMLISSPIVAEHQSILDVFLLQGLINYEDYQKLKNRFTSNAEAENYLLKNKLISKDAINRAYSIILKIPFVSLSNLKISPSVLEIAKPDFIRKYRAAPFSLKNKVIGLAIAEPGNFAANIEAMESYFKNKVDGINIYITASSDIEAVLKQFNGEVSDRLLNKASYPTVFLKNQNISKDLLNLLPANFIVKYHLVIFAKKDDQNFSIATDLIDNPETLKAIRAVEDQNGIFFEIFATSSDDISYIINLISDKRAEAKTEEPQKSPLPDEGGIIKSFKDFIGQSGDSSDKITIESVKKNQVSEPETPKQPEQDEKIKVDVDKISDNKIKNKETEPKSDEKISNQTDELNHQSNDKLLAEERQDIGTLLDKEINSKEEILEIVKSGEVPKIVAALISYALNLRASDIHMEPEIKYLRVRFRVDGILQDVVNLPPEIQPQIISRIKILSLMKLDESRIPQDGRFDVNFHQKQVDIRVSSLPTVRGEKIVMRLLDKSQGILSLEDLGMVGRSFKLTIEEMAKPYGIIISTGPTGSGKSTTLYAILNRISVPAVNIVTLEDPVEYEIPGINQCQIKPKIGFSFADGLRSILRQDPNVIMVGEVRDLETAGMAAHAALTGHLVLTTLHTNDAAGALPRLTNMGVEPFLITSSINLIIAQRLVRRICPKCREEVKLPENLIKIIENDIAAIPKSNKDDLERVKTPLQFFQGRGCKECNQGYRGRLGLFESLRVTDKIEELVISKAPSSDIATEAINDGMITIRQDGILKALVGLTTIDEVFRVTAAFN